MVEARPAEATATQQKKKSRLTGSSQSERTLPRPEGASSSDWLEDYRTLCVCVHV